ncbi:hypothetical protein C7S13_3833 [Burkholderia cepacia]|nr:hypothetical protein [Burkholderia cepacia]
MRRTPAVFLWSGRVRAGARRRALVCAPETVRGYRGVSTS